MADDLAKYPQSKPDFKNGRYGNPWGTWDANHFSVSELFKFYRTENKTQLPSQDILNMELPVLKPDFNQPSSGSMKVTWLGHATVMVQTEQCTVLTDPAFSPRCSPVFFYGPQRYRPPPCKIDEFPKIDAVLISHNHYDHLDKQTIKEIVKEQKKTHKKIPHFFVPKGLRQWFLNLPDIEETLEVHEMSWWERLPCSNQENMFVTCAPAQHWSTRNWTDRNKSLWCSWAVEMQTKNFFFAGDTGYFPEFHSIGRWLGPFDVAAIPIGCYEPEWFMKAQHIGPSEAVQIHKEIQSEFSVGVHWGTYDMGSKEYYLEPREKLLEEVKQLPNPKSFITLNHGESFRV